MSQKPKTTGKAKSFTIDRGKWLQGGVLKRDTSKSSLLKDHGGNMCCLGFYSEACGARGLRGTVTPGLLEKNQARKLDHRITDGFTSTPLAHRLMGMNDNESTRDKIREDRIKRAFAKLGITVKFKGKYPYDLKDK